jgi:2-oxoisovalerate dehydrogenase E1 component
MDAAKLAAARANAPLIAYRRHLIHTGMADEASLAAIEAAAAAEIDAAQQFAQDSAAAGPAELYTDIFADPSAIPDRAFAAPVEAAPLAGRKLMYGQAINEAQDQALAADERVILLGEDIMDPAGGIVKATYGLSTKYGTARVRGTPISEQAIVGASIGAALAGLRPIAEIMINDFAMVCMDQIANHAAKLRYMSGGRTSVPLVLRMLTAGKMGSFGAQHSQSLEAWFAHTPGLKIVAPSNAYDAKGLLLAAVDDPDPVIVLEAMRCYFVPGDVPEAPYRVPLGVAKTVRSGTDLTIISYSWAMQEALAAAASLAEEGIDAEVIDLRSLVPLDMAAIEASVGRTGRALIVHAAVEFCGFGAELAARLQERLWGRLKAPVGRVGARYTPVPFAQGLEAMHFPDAAAIVAKARALMAAR